MFFLKCRFLKYYDLKYYSLKRIFSSGAPPSAHSTISHSVSNFMGTSNIGINSTQSMNTSSRIMSFDGVGSTFGELTFGGDMVGFS